jgi:hypothetical protein
MKALIYLAFFCIILFGTLCGCSKDDESDLSYYHGILLNMSAFDGCGWIIEIDDQAIVEPSNLNEFNIILKDSARVGIRYHVANNQNSNCMMGTVINILDIYYE